MFDYANIQLEKEHNEEYKKSSSNRGILLLCQAMAELAVADIKKNQGRDQALSWIMENDNNYQFSFLRSCEILRMNPANIRRAVTVFLQSDYVKPKRKRSKKARMQ